MLDVTVIVLTKDERLHIGRCLENVGRFAAKVFVVDCFSTDGTQQIAREMGAEVVEHEWPGNQAAQFNWVLENLDITTEWVLRLDADEYLLPELIDELLAVLPGLPTDVTGVVFNRRHIFMGKWMRRGIYPVKMLRLFRRGHGVCEQRLMDEHITLKDGVAYECRNDFCDHNLHDISWFCKKHVDYAVREAAEMLDTEFGFSDNVDDLTGMSCQAREKRRRKLAYTRRPLFWRSTVYFLYRYLLKGAWREGKEGFVFTFLQGWWYRTLVDAKVMEIKRACGDDRERIRGHLKEMYNISL